MKIRDAVVLAGTFVLVLLFWSTSATAVTLSVDIGQTGTGNDVQFGWEDFSQASGSTGSITVTSGLGNGNSVTVDLTGIGGWRDRGNVLHPIGDALEDAVFTNSTMPLTLKNLKTGTYYFRSYHHNTPSNHGAIDVRLTDVTRANRLMVSNLPQTYGPSGGSAGPAATVPLIVQANGTDDVVISVVKKGFVGYINGFEITDSAPADLKVDFGLGPEGRAGNDVQTGFQSFAMENSGSYIPSPQEHWFFTELGNAGSARVRLSTDGNVGFRDRSDVTHPLGDLLEDHVFDGGSDRLDLTLGSLKPGLYSITTYHHDSQYNRGTIDVSVSDALGTERLAVSSLDETTGTSPANVATATVSFYSNGVDPVTVHMDRNTAANIWLNGFEAAAAAPALRVDFAHSTQDATYGHEVQNGFVAFARATSNATPNDQSETFTSDLGTGGEVTVRVRGDGGVYWRDRGDVVNSELGDLAEDLILKDDWVELVLEDLVASRYIVTTYHNDPGHPGLMDIEVSDALGTGRSIVTGLAKTGTYSGDPATMTFDIYASGPVTIRFNADAYADKFAVLNGFSLTMAVPEPSTFALGCLGLCSLVLLASRRRKR